MRVNKQKNTEPNRTGMLTDQDRLDDFAEQVEAKYGVDIDEPIPARLAELVLRIRELKDR